MAIYAPRACGLTYAKARERMHVLSFDNFSHFLRVAFLWRSLWICVFQRMAVVPTNSTKFCRFNQKLLVCHRNSLITPGVRCSSDNVNLPSCMNVQTKGKVARQHTDAHTYATESLPGCHFRRVAGFDTQIMLLPVSLAISPCAQVLSENHVYLRFHHRRVGCLSHS
jgi:hypothetical protein